MIIHCLNDTPDTSTIDIYGAWTELVDDELEIVDADEIWYWYECALYEGSGQLIARKGELYLHHDMGHCSCFGPTERIGDNYEPLESLKARWDNNPSAWKEVVPLFNEIK